ncbi:hypothetical protein MVES_000809 [Malassezia vespertilionis]|uniref:Glycoside hydrolase family 5 C-terminal domain-containing protein n=1 Tax=Malassezia vespertilionis TaxID=2020962 RepID=A0A2N1JE88_9BASI|nr:hypothetical protein MVES_000809 [Malassezia vespertilionis]
MVAHDLSDAALGGKIRTRGRYLSDAHGRTLLLRGMNVSGVSKLPTKPAETKATYSSPETVSFVDRPCTLQEAPGYFARLQAWGMPLVRLLVTWEALSPQGPCPQYPIAAEYVAYLVELFKVMAQYKIKCVVCAHQDVWSRLTGGSGAPGWTLRAAGLDPAQLQTTGAALVPESGTAPLSSTPPAHKEEPTGPFNWPSGYQKLAPATMATLFWGGRMFAPGLRLLIDGAEQNIQDVLQHAYIEAYTQLAAHLAPCEAFAGMELMNEPHRGFINLYSFHRWCYETDLHIGHYPSALESMALGDGYAQEIPFYVKSWPFPSRVSHRTRVDPRARAWIARAENDRFVSTRKSDGCIWREHGVWEWDAGMRKPVVLQADYFSVDPRPKHGRRKVEWYCDFYAPFIAAFHARIQQVCSHGLLLVEPIPNEFMPRWAPGADDTPCLSTAQPPNLVYAPHFYDLNVLFFKAYNGMSVNVQGLSRGMFILCAVYFGARGLARNYYYQLSQLVRRGYERVGQVPVLIGEAGVPYDVNQVLHTRPGDYRVQNTLLDALVSGLERNLVSFTLWNYNPTNTVQHGDGWNMEDFSVINLEAGAADTANKRPAEPLYRGGRALNAILRPYVAKVAGIPCSTAWDARRQTLTFQWRNGPSGNGPRVTECFIPDYHFRSEPICAALSDGAYRTATRRRTRCTRL